MPEKDEIWFFLGLDNFDMIHSYRHFVTFFCRLIKLSVFCKAVNSIAEDLDGFYCVYLESEKAVESKYLSLTPVDTFFSSVFEKF